MELLIPRQLFDKIRGDPDMLEALVFEVPDEALDRYLGLRDLVPIEVGQELHDVVVSMAADFGLTEPGLLLLASAVLDKMVQVREKYDKFKIPD